MRQKPITTVLGSKAQLSTHGGVRVQTTGIDELDPDDPAYKMQDSDSLPYRYTLEIEEDTLSGKKKLTAPSDKGCIEIEITTNPGEEGHQVTDASLHMKKESEIPMNKQIAEISTGSYISSLGSRANTFIDVASDKYTSILFIETENKSDELTVDVKSFSHVEPKHKTGVDAMGKPLTYTSQFTHSKDKAPPPETVAISQIDDDNVSIGNSEIARIQNRSIRSISDSVDEYLINQGEEIKFPIGVDNNDDNTDGSQPLTRSTSSTKISSLSDETEGFTDSNSENENIFSAQLLEQIK
ncbi:uncharacterized protein LOC123300618 [Chrysoperla carnea]|uniref:uncharacterized protein LOC123300618 n=1 Tax=Chrysoperla carnea TaxID=189513 RepID=UPI001D06A8F0|nr:uncharacterized protein LOC123300618 [Chrysoperla carnea]